MYKTISTTLRSICAIILLQLAIACSNKQPDSIAVDELSSLLGTQLNVAMLQQSTTLFSGQPEKFETEHLTIINYIDSADCTPCRLRFDLWNSFMGALDSLAPNSNVSLIYIIEPTDLKPVERKIRQNNFKFPIAIDSAKVLKSMIHLPCDIRMHTFLLNNEDEIIGIGNPVLNPNIKDLYLKLMNREHNSSR